MEEQKIQPEDVRQDFELVAKTMRGLEDVLRDELVALGARDVEMGNRMVSFRGDKRMMYMANFCTRTALRVLKPVVKFTARDTDELYDRVRDLPWEDYISPDGTFAIDATVNSAEFSHSRYVTYRVKDAIVDHFTDKFRRRPSIRIQGADVLLNVHISDTRVTISLDSSGAPLNQRGYRTETLDAPLNEVLAAGIILKTGWRGDTNFVDPMCGSGTFLIEAALIATNTWPGIYRKGFAFEKWPDFDAELLAEIAADDSAEREFEFKIYGGDKDPEAIAVARKNIRNASLERCIDLRCCDIVEWTDAPKPGILITNPPYGERLRPDDINDLYRSIGDTLKARFSGYHAWILGYKEETMKCIGLKPSVKFPVLNGDLECRLNEYVLFDGSYNGFRASGGSVRNEEFNREVKPRLSHISDGEWQEETRRYGDRKRDRKERKEFRGDKERRADRERRRDFKRDGDRPFKKDFKRRDDRDDRKGERPFKKDFKRRDGERDERREQRRSKGEGRQYRPREAAVVPDRAPRLPAESAIQVGSGLKMRSRKGWYKKPDAENPAADTAADSSSD